MKKFKAMLPYALLLLVSFAAQTFHSIVPVSAGTSFLTMIWLCTSLELTYRYPSKKRLWLTGIVFVAGYVIKFWGSMGNVLLDLVLFGVFGTALFAVFFFSGMLLRKWDNFPGTLVFPVLYTVLYLAVTLLHMPTLVRVDMLFINNPVFVHAERAIGAAGFQFGLLWIASMLRMAFSKRKKRYIVLSYLVFVLMLIPGTVELFPNVTTTASFRAAYTTGPYGGGFSDYVAPSYEVNEESLTRSITNAAAEKADILVFNEEAFELDDTEEGPFLETCASLARENRIAVLVGLDVRDTDGSEGGKSLDKIVLIDADGKLRAPYLKSRLIPIIESDYVRGTGDIPFEKLTLNGHEVNVSYLICYDSNFPSYVRGVNDDTDILLLPSWDWHAVTDLHAKLCRTIAIENGFYLLKCTYDGVSIVCDPAGNVFYESSTDETGYEHLHIAEIPVKSSAVPVTEEPRPSLIHAIITANIFSVLVCFILFAGTHTLNTERTKRSYVFSMILVTNVAACGMDALSWAADGHIRLMSVVTSTTIPSLLASFVLMWEFVFYLYEYIREKTPVSAAPAIVFSVLTAVSILATIAMALSGRLYSVENAIFVEGPLYGVYLILNTLLLLGELVAITIFGRKLSNRERIVAYFYLLIPLVGTIINLFVENWSFAYPASTLSMLLIYVMMQSGKMEQIRREEMLVSYHVTHDELTGLCNRLAYEKTLERLAETDLNVGVIYSDMNGLKYANDNYGHSAGDRLLIRYADTLKELFRSSEVYRISGDEFICLMENVSENIFRTRLDQLEKYVTEEEQPLSSVGAAYGGSRQIAGLIRDAESAMYRKKDAFHRQYPNMTRE